MEWQKTDTLIPFTRLELVPRPRLQARIAEGLRGPLTLIAAPAGFGKTTLVASYVAGCGMPATLFLVHLDDERTWYRYHHLFAGLLRTQLQASLGAQGVAQLHVRASDWHAQNGSILEAIHHASAASDDERVERFIEQHYFVKSSWESSQ